jgi:transposase-like protein
VGRHYGFQVNWIIPKVMEFLQKGHRVSQAEESFGISGFTIHKWRRKLEETENLEDGPRQANLQEARPRGAESLRGRAPRRLP